MTKEQLINELKKQLKVKHLEIVFRGNSAIDSALSILPKNRELLIPEEGGWIHYQKAPGLLGLTFAEVKCQDAKIDLDDLKNKVSTKKYSAFLYETPGGYFVEEPIQEIYNICKENDCLVILDVSGSIGTGFYNSKYADILIGSFGRWKPINAEVGGFVATNDKKLWERLWSKLGVLEDSNNLQKISEALKAMPERITFLQETRTKVIADLSTIKEIAQNILFPNDYGLVVIVKFADDKEKTLITNYCEQNNLPYTECPRYIRVNSKAISIEIKKL